ncbi:MAG: cytochrome c [Saprospirales bacterium]|nr:MAG: cytochrome c [Saprospirales bacterium]
MTARSNISLHTAQERPTDKLVQNWMAWAMGFLVIVSFMGLALRYYFIGEVPGLSFNNIKHGHSHAAMLGWAFMAASGMLIHFFVKTTRSLGQYQWMLFLNAIAVIGMIVSFPLEGYGMWSIIFSTLHVLVAYWFAIIFLRDLKKSDRSAEGKRFARWSVIWMLVSTIGLWSVAPVSALLGGLHPLYFMSIQWYLHYQLVGWFSYVIIAGLIVLSNCNGFKIKLPKGTFEAIQVSLILTYALSVNWSSPASALFYINAAGVVIQAVAFYYLLKPLMRIFFNEFSASNRAVTLLLRIGLLTLVVRILIQTLVVLPEVAEISYTLRMYVIAFVHLIMLGTFTLTLAGILLSERVFKINFISTSGWLVFALAFLLTEFMLFGQGTMLWAGLGFISGFYTQLFYASLLFLIGSILAFTGQWVRSKNNQSTNHYSTNKLTVL